MANEKVTLPNTAQPVIDSSGRITQPWLRFLEDIARKINALNES